MKVWWMAAIPAVTMWTGLARGPVQDTETEPVRRAGTQEQPLTAAPQDPVEAGRAFDAEAWRAALTEVDLDVREESFDRLIREHTGDDAALRVLRDWAEGGSDLAWTARLALRELQAPRPDPDFGYRDEDPGDPFPWTLPDPFDRSLFGRDPFGGDLFRGHRDVQELLDSMRERMRGGFGRTLPFGGGPGTGSSRSQSFQMQIGPDGVRVERIEDEDGNVDTKVYEAESLEKLLELHPELRESIGTQRSQGLDLETLFPLEPLRRVAPPPADGAVPTHMLGVRLREPSEAARRSGASDVGLVVESTLPHTIASELGLERGDVLLELDGRRLLSAADVRAALEARAQDAPIELELIDAAGERLTLIWKPGE